MIATSVAYSMWFVLHLVVALGTVLVISGLRFTAVTVLRNDELESLLTRFPDRVNWAARIVHLAPITGLILSLTGDPDVSLARAWVGAGIALYFVLAYWIEAKVLPAEREVARLLRSDQASAATAAQSMASRIDVALVLLTLILVTMIVQF